MTEPSTIPAQTIEWQTGDGNKAICTVARLDEIHPIISGNKFFKLKYNLQKAIETRQGIITMGGAFSNHLAATAFACKEMQLKSIGLVRGMITEPLNHTLHFCKEQGMQLIEVARQEYKSNSETIKEIQEHHPGYLFVPEGGANAYGEKGCEEIPELIPDFNSFSHIVCAIGTGTTVRGISKSCRSHQTMIGIPVIKIKPEERPAFIQAQTPNNLSCRLQFYFEFAGKGYAKQEQGLFDFMNLLFKQTSMPTDFVYTAKVFNAINSLFDAGYFSMLDRVLVLHTGGLQGNLSLATTVLDY